MRSNPQHRLNRKYYDPYLVLEKIGVVTHRMDLPTNSLVHPTFHVSLLKKVHEIAQTLLPLPSVEGMRNSLFLSEAILDRKLAKRQNRYAVKVLVR